MGHVLADALTLWETGDLVKLFSFFCWALELLWSTCSPTPAVWGGDGRFREVVKNLLRGEDFVKLQRFRGCYVFEPCARRPLHFLVRVLASLRYRYAQGKFLWRLGNFRDADDISRQWRAASTSSRHDEGHLLTLRTMSPDSGCVQSLHQLSSLKTSMAPCPFRWPACTVLRRVMTLSSHPSSGTPGWRLDRLMLSSPSYLLQLTAGVAL